MDGGIIIHFMPVISQILVIVVENPVAASKPPGTIMNDNLGADSPAAKKNQCDAVHLGLFEPGHLNVLLMAHFCRCPR